MAPMENPRYAFNTRAIFTDAIKRDIGGGIILWRGYFQSVRPAIGRLLLNIDTATGVTYKPGRLMDLALEFLRRRRGEYDALAPRSGFPGRERNHLQTFLSNIKILTPHSPHHPEKRRLVKGLTRLGAREESFEIEDGRTVTVAEYFRRQYNIALRYPDVICVEVCAWSTLSEYVFSASSSSRLGRGFRWSYARSPQVNLYVNRCRRIRSTTY